MNEVIINDNKTIYVEAWFNSYAFAGQIKRETIAGVDLVRKNQRCCYAEFQCADGERRWYEFIFPVEVMNYPDFKQYLYRELEKAILKHQWTAANN